MSKSSAVFEISKNSQVLFILRSHSKRAILQSSHYKPIWSTNRIFKSERDTEAFFGENTHTKTLKYEELNVQEK